ncbi:peptidylprolyl isomerase [Paenibacillus massiliensis]|uniref:peptidylprolyl isomerase n=1 Tax=Paenibacillus massiliensis TaxID=225917 RepID=UPI0003FF0639|nr:lipoprotein [Paenibacillus massiliensis]
MLSNRLKSWRTLLLTLAVVAAVSLLAACGQKGDQTQEQQDNSKVVATYDGGQITENEFNLELGMMKMLYPEYEQMLAMDEFRETIVKQEIAYKYLAGQADEKAQQDGAKSAEEQFANFKNSVGEEQFQKMLTDQKLSEQDVKNYMTRIMTVIKSETNKVTDEQVKKEFETNIDQFTTASVRHVLINFTDPKTNKERPKEEALKLAKEVKDKLDNGADFAEIAKKYSEDPGSAENGGLYENSPVGQWVEAFKEAAKTQKVGEIGEPVETEYGYHIIKVESRNEASFDKLTAEQKDGLKNKLASDTITNFMSTELEGKIKSIDLPKAPAAEGTEGQPENSGATTPEGSTENKPGDAGAGGNATDGSNAANDGAKDATEGK